MPGINKTVSAETPATALTGAELTRIVQGGASVRTTTQDIANLGYQSPLTTKGDIAVFGTANTRQAVGTDGQDLIADSTSPTGLSWTSRFTTFVANLLDYTNASNGAGMVGFGYSLSYASNTIGAWLKNLATSAGATFIGYLSPSTGAMLRTQQLKNQDTISILEFTGIDPTGATSSRTAAQAFITACMLQGGDQRIGLWRKGTYLIDGSLTVGSNVCIVFEPGVVINFTGDVNTSLFNSANQANNYFIGNGATINGNRSGVTLSNAGNQNAFYIYGSDNVLIQDFNIANFAMDGITITGDTGTSGPSTNIRIVGVDSHNSGRNGMSIIHAIGVVVEGGRYWGSNGTPSGPWAGIDVEPNSGEVAQAIVISGVRTQANVGAGLQFTPSAMSANSGQTYDVAVMGGRSTGDGATSGIPALYFASGGAYTNEVNGQITVRSFVIENPVAMGVGFQNWDAILAPRVVMEDVQVINPNGASGSTGNENQSGFVINCSAAQAVTNMGKITMRNCKAQDNRASPKMVWGAVVEGSSGKGIQDVLIQDFTAVNYVAASKADVNTVVSANSILTDVVVNYINPKPVSSAGSVTATNWGGKRVNLTTGGSSFTLPLAAQCKGLYYEVQADAAAASNCSVVVSGSDHIKVNGVAQATSYILQPGDVARFRSLGGSLWSGAAIN